MIPVRNIYYMLSYAFRSLSKGPFSVCLDEEFENTLENLRKCHFSFLHVFPYSKRDGTLASTMKGEIHGSIVKQRTDRLLEISKQLRNEDMKRFDELEVLIERQDDQGNYHGYTSQYHPVIIQSDQKLEGRMKVKKSKIIDGVYYADQKEGVVCD